MNNVLIRPANTFEQPALETLQLRASLNNPGDRHSLLTNPDAIELPIEQITSGRVLVAEWDGAVVGFSAVLLRPDGDTELDGLFVEPDVWRHGIGRSLVEHCCQAARIRVSAVLHVVGNPHAEGFYLGCGFKTVGTVETRFGVGLLMQKVL